MRSHVAEFLIISFVLVATLLILGAGVLYVFL